MHETKSRENNGSKFKRNVEWIDRFLWQESIEIGIKDGKKK